MNIYSLKINESICNANSERWTRIACIAIKNKLNVMNKVENNGNIVETS